MSEDPRIVKLEAAIKLYGETIASFERARGRMTQRRKGAPDSVMQLIDERLALNERTLKSLRRVLEITETELRNARRRGDTN
jgi:hypothetical protein